MNSFTTEQLATAFNKWQDDYIADPSGFTDNLSTALQHIEEKEEGLEPSYGKDCATLLLAYLEELNNDE